MRGLFLKSSLAAMLLLAGELPRAAAQLVGLPAAPELSPAGRQLLMDFEVGGGERYYVRHLARPTWPGAASGVTVGVGYDTGYNSTAVIRSDWRRLSATIWSASRAPPA